MNALNSPIHVCHIATIDLSLRYLLLNQLQSIQSAGYMVSGISAPGDAVPAIRASGIQHFAVPFVRASNLTPFADLLAFWQIYRTMRRERFAIVHTHTAKGDLYGSLAARLAGVPIVVTTLHGFYFHDLMPAHWRRFYIALATLAARCADVLLSQNPEDIDVARRERVCPPVKIKFLGNGIDLRRFDRARLDACVIESKRRALGLPPGAPVIGFVGRLVRDKGILELLQTMQTIRAQLPDARLLIVGMIDHAKRDVMTPEIAAEYGVADMCIFAGHREDMPELYALMDVFVLPSHREAFPRAPMEAAAMGVPCVATNVRGCRTVVEDGRNGTLVPLGDVPALANAILDLLNDPAKARRMGESGKRIARDRFDEQLVFEKVKSEYARLLQAKGLLSLRGAS